MYRTTIVFAMLTLAGCNPSEIDLQLDYDDFVALHQQCQVSEDCALVVPDCPLGCYFALADGSADDAQAFADELVGYYEAAIGHCENSCPPAPGVACRNQRCTTCNVSAGESDCIRR